MSLQQRPPRPSLLCYGWGIITPVCCTILVWPIRDFIGSAGILMVYLLGVFLVANHFGRLPSFLASILSAPAFAYFFAPPIFSLAITDLKNIVGLGVMLVVANVTSGLVENLKCQADIASRRERRSASLYQLSSALANIQTEYDIAVVTFDQIHNEFGVHSSFLSESLLDNSLKSIEQTRKHILPSFVDGQFVGNILKGATIDSIRHCIDIQGSHYYLLKDLSNLIGVLVLPPEFSLSSNAPEETHFFEMFLSQITQATVRIRLSQQAKRAVFQAESESLRNSLLSAISHDLRTPLTRIVGTASALVEQDEILTPSERIEFTVAIQDEAKHMAELMSKILDMARLTAGKIVPHKEWNAVEELIGSTLARLELALQGRDILVRIPPDLPLIQVDAVLLQQVFINILDNAIKYTPPGSPIQIHTTLKSDAIEIHFIDRGPGIPEHQAEQLFRKFHRLVSESTITGVGLGLALCHSIMEAHGGNIHVDSNPKGGAIFVLSIPLSQPPQDIKSLEK